MKVTLAFLLLPITLVLADPYKLSFNPSISEAQNQVATYSMWVQATNAPDVNQYKWIGSCSLGQTNIYFDSVNLTDNPCYIVITANNSVGHQGPFSQNYLFDTNNFPTIIIVTNPPSLVPPTVLNVQRLN